MSFLTPSQDVISIYAWPILIAGLAVPATLTSLSILHTHPKSPARVLVVLVTVYLSYLRLLAAPHLTGQTMWNVNLGGTAVNTCVHITSLLLLVRPGAAAVGGRFSRGVSLALGFRGIGSPYQVKGVPAIPGAAADGRPPSRARYLARQAVVIAWQYLFLDALDQLALATDPVEKVAMYGASPGIEWDPRPWNQTSLQIAGRVMAVVFSWFIVTRLTLCWMYNMTAFVAVVSGISDVQDWPPLFGSYKDAFTIRGIWGNSWHQMLRWDFSTIATWLTRDVLRLPKPSLLERYSHIIFVFGLSALLHVAVDIMSGFPLEDGGSMFFFNTFPLAIMIEDGVQALWRSLTGAAKTDKTPYWHKVIGFAWTLTWFTATLPAYFYNFVRAPKETSWTMPYSFLEGFDPNITLGGSIALGLLLAWPLRAEL